jgi:hypothetical protein
VDGHEEAVRLLEIQPAQFLRGCAVLFVRRNARLVIGRFWMRDSAGETPADAVGTTALPRKPGIDRMRAADSLAVIQSI